jgi:hypothetical protein
LGCRPLKRDRVRLLAKTPKAPSPSRDPNEPVCDQPPRAKAANVALAEIERPGTGVTKSDARDSTGEYLRPSCRTEASRSSFWLYFSTIRTSSRETNRGPGFEPPICSWLLLWHGPMRRIRPDRPQLGTTGTLASSTDACPLPKRAFGIPEHLSGAAEEANHGRQQRRDGRTLAEAFAYIEHVDRHPGWQEKLVSSKPKTEGPLRAGSRIDQVRRVSGGPRHLRSRSPSTIRREGSPGGR